MNLEKIVFGFFIVLALTLNFAFVYGSVDNPEHHNIVGLFFVVVVNIIATGLKVGDRSQIGALLLSTSLVADLQLIAASIVWAFAIHVWDSGMTPAVMSGVVSLAAGALVANVVSVTIVVSETLMVRR